MSEPLYPFQRDTIARLVKGGPIFVALEMGLGKSRCAIEAAVQLDAQRILVVCPAIGRVSWPVEVAKWAPGALASVLRHSRALRHRSTREFVVISYDSLSSNREWIELLRAWRPEVVILDEAHYLKTSSAKRTRACYGARIDGAGGLIEGAKHVWPMSGTPMLSYSSELWTHLHALKPSFQKMREHEFQERYSTFEQTQWGARVNGSKNTAELRAACAGFFHNVRAADVLHDLPPIAWTVEPIEALIPPVLAGLAEIRDLDDEALLDWLRDHEVALSSARRRLGMAKIKGAAAWAEYFLDNQPTKSLLLFAHHRDVITGLATALKRFNPAVIHGGTPIGQRIWAVNGFQARRTRLFIGQSSAAGTAITLTASHDVAFVEQDWVPSIMAQAAARCHRIGQRQPVMARVLAIYGSLDEIISRVLAAKARQIGVMFNQPRTQERADVVQDAV